MKCVALLSVVACAFAVAIWAANGDDILVPPRREVYGNGRIFDISHRYHPEMPEFESKDGIGQFLWLPKSMKNGSIANNSEMKLPTHTGTHVDAPGHVFDHYFDAGFDVDTLDLDILNGHFSFIILSFSNSFVSSHIIKEVSRYHDWIGCGV